MIDHKYSILVVDDDAENRNMMVSFLENDANYVLYTANNGKVALEIARLEIPDIIVLDWQMPEMNGIEVLKELKKKDETKEIPVIMFTGIMTDTVSLRESLRLGANDFLKKPVEPIEIEARILSILKHIEHQKELAQKELKILQLEKSTLSLELEAKQKEVITYAKSLSSKNELFSQYLEGMKSFISSEKLTANQVATLDAMSNDLKQSMNVLKGYEEFAALFQQLNPSFFKALDALNIPLTENERQLLSFIKLNLSNREIAALLFVSLSAVEKAKYRLKIKLNIESEITLNDFILNL